MKHISTPENFQISAFTKSVKAALVNYLCTNKWEDFKFRNTPNICAFPKGISTCVVIASDGSYKDNLASFAVKCQSHSFLSTLPGMQSIQRAELFGLLAAIWITDLSTPLIIVTDSYSSKSVIDHLWNQRLMPRQCAFPANRSILLSIIQLLEERERSGSSTRICWICSHTTDNDDKLKYLLNAAAD
jgi:hypothetical protein